MYQPERTLNSADETSVMKMPNQQMMAHPKQMMQQPRKFGNVRPMTDPLDMIRISPLKYIVFNNPQGTHDYLYSKGVDVRNNVLSVYETAKKFAAQGGELAIMDMVKNIDTPYKQMILKAHAQETGFEGGNQKPGSTTEKSNEPAKTTEKTEEKGVFKISTQTIIIALVIVIFFLIVLRK